MKPLAPCPSCARHIRVSERGCPFCSAELSNGEWGKAVPAAPRGHRLSRAATLVFGAALTVSGCGGAPPNPTGPSDGAPDGDEPVANDGGDPSSDDNMVVAPMYGAPPPVDDSSGPPDDDGAAVAEYGAPMPEE